MVIRAVVGSYAVVLSGTAIGTVRVVLGSASKSLYYIVQDRQADNRIVVSCDHRAEHRS